MKGIEVAKTYLGMREVRDRVLLQEFFSSQGISCNPKTTPWCAAFVNSCERSAGFKGNGRLNARSFLTYGVNIDEENAEEGDILIFDFEGDGIHGHVTYFVEWDDDNNQVKCLGGNQTDQVCYAYYSQDKIVGIRRSQ